MAEAGGRSGDGAAFMRRRFGIDEAMAQSLLDAALSRGGDYAELYFEHKDAGSIQFEQQAVKSANRSITQGLGVRVLLGEAVGYAYTEDLSRGAMMRAAETAAKIASRGDTRQADRRRPLRDAASHYSPDGQHR